MTITAEQVLEAAKRERSDWYALRNYPGTDTLRNMLALADFAATEPRRWRIIRDRFIYPELTQSELSVVHGVSLPTLRKELAPVDLQEYLKHYEELERDACGSR